MNQSDIEEITGIVRTYYDSMYRGDGAGLRSAFDAHATFFGMRDGQTVRRTLDEFVEFVRGDDDADYEYRWDITLVDVCDVIGIVKLTDTYRGRRYTDYLTLAKGPDGWKIVNKAFLATS